MKQGVEVGEAGTGGGEGGKILVLAGELIVSVFENDDDNPVEMVGVGVKRVGAGGSARR